MKEKLKEIYEGLNERLKSPFLLTFIIVWSIHNWEIVYALITLNSDIPFQDRASTIMKYLTISRNNNELFCKPIIWTFASIILYFAATFISEGIHLAYSKWARAGLYFAIDRNKLKTIDDFNELETRRRNLQELVFDLKKKEEDASLKLKATEKALNAELDLERNKVSIAISEALSLNEKIKELNEECDSLKSTLVKKDDNYKELDNKLKKLELEKKSLHDFINAIISRNPNEFQEAQKLLINIDENIATIINNERFTSIFQGTWSNTYSAKNGKAVEEHFKLSHYKNNLAFLVNGKEIMIITDITFPNENTITFTKTNIKTPNNKLLNNLKIIDQSTLHGMENNEIDVLYKKIKS